MSLTVPYISIKPGYFTLFRLPLESYRSREITPEIRERLRHNQPAGIVSQKARRRISCAIDWMLYLSTDKSFYSPKHKKRFNFKLNFVTLTLASKQQHPDQVIKSQLLNQFLIELKRDFNVDNYIWRAESQKNDNIHFHLITDKFIPWSQLRKSWNRIQEKLGYVSAYRKEMEAWHNGGFRARPELFKRWSLQQQKQAYKTGHKGNWSNPNSTDIHSVTKVKNLSAYISKYMAKETDYTLKPIAKRQKTVMNAKGERNVFTVTCVERVPLYRPIEGKLWGLSHKLSKLKSVVLLASGQIAEEIHQLWKRYGSKIKVKDYYSVLYMNMKSWLNASVPAIKKAFDNRLADIVRGEVDSQVLQSVFDRPPPVVVKVNLHSQLSISFNGSTAFGI